MKYTKFIKSTKTNKHYVDAIIGEKELKTFASKTTGKPVHVISFCVEDLVEYTKQNKPEVYTPKK